jgi:predicted dehydrogenase
VRLGPFPHCAPCPTISRSWGVANTSRASAEAAAACGVRHAFTNVAELVACPEVDIVAVTVKVPIISES